MLSAPLEFTLIGLGLNSPTAVPGWFWAPEPNVPTSSWPPDDPPFEVTDVAELASVPSLADPPFEDLGFAE